MKSENYHQNIYLATKNEQYKKTSELNQGELCDKFRQEVTTAGLVALSENLRVC